MLGIIRLIILVALGWMAYRYIRRFLALDKPAERTDSRSAHQTESLPMQRCAQCHTHLPEGESTRSSGHYFCSEAHRDAWLAANSDER